ncbi:MAG: enoyl-CoA hydratase/isomerase family protein [Pseudomonadota bacterium]
MSLVASTIRDGIRTLTINRPQALNALNDAVMADLLAALDAIAADPATRVVVLTGAGERAFVAGADVKAMADMDRDAAYALSRRAQGLQQRLRTLPQPVIARIRGFCLGGGLELALGCDLRIATTDARFGLPEVSLGILPGGGGVTLLHRIIGAGPARRLCLTGEIIDAAAALRLGLVGEVVEPDALDARVRAVALQLARRSAHGLAQLKRALEAAETLDVEQGLAAEARAFAGCFDHSDQREGMTAFVEKRPARFAGAPEVDT